MATEVKLGWKAKDVITGFTGVVVAYTRWLNGCVRVVLEPSVDKDKKRVDNLSVDIQQVEYIGRKAIMIPSEPVAVVARLENVVPPITREVERATGGDRDDRVATQREESHPQL